MTQTVIVKRSDRISTENDSQKKLSKISLTEISVIVAAGKKWATVSTFPRFPAVARRPAATEASMRVCRSSGRMGSCSIGRKLAGYFLNFIQEGDDDDHDGAHCDGKLSFREARYHTSRKFEEDYEVERDEEGSAKVLGTGFNGAVKICRHRLTGERYALKTFVKMQGKTFTKTSIE
jgi:hypothetical protein